MTTTETEKRTADAIKADIDAARADLDALPKSADSLDAMNVLQQRLRDLNAELKTAGPLTSTLPEGTLGHADELQISIERIEKQIARANNSSSMNIGELQLLHHNLEEARKVAEDAWKREVEAGGSQSPPAVAVLLREQAALDTSGLPVIQIAQRKNEIANEIVATRKRLRADFLNAEEAARPKTRMDEILADLIALETRKNELDFEIEWETDAADAARVELETVIARLAECRELQTVEQETIQKQERRAEIDARKAQLAAEAEKREEKARVWDARAAQLGDVVRAFDALRPMLTSLVQIDDEWVTLDGSNKTVGMQLAAMALVVLEDAGVKERDMDPSYKMRIATRDLIADYIAAEDEPTKPAFRTGEKRCKACDHADSAAINAALTDKTPLRELEGRFGISKSALSVHKNVCLSESA